MTAEARGFLEVALISLLLFAGGAAFSWSRRRLLRRWHVVVPGVLLAVATVLALPMVRDLREHAGGEAGAWGRMGELIILMGLVPVACVVAGAFVGALVALARHGFADAATLARQPRVPWYTPFVRRRTPAELTLRLYMSLGSLVIVGILWLLGVRPGA
ncbi:MAG: hypothetical protein LCH84_14275 [Gemmatimonadetes bacterium]|nr:hypothetical protein [Gemmatimonadota bacterium]